MPQLRTGGDLVSDYDQLDLFGERQTDFDWIERFERDRVEVVIDRELGAFEMGSTALAWRCPSCGELELTPYFLWINHGFDPKCRQASTPIERGCHRRREIQIDKPFHPTTEETL